MELQTERNVRSHDKIKTLDMYKLVVSRKPSMLKYVPTQIKIDNPDRERGVENMRDLMNIFEEI